MTSGHSCVLLWVRRDLRLADNAALTAAIETGKKVIVLFIWSPSEEAPWQPGAASNVYLHYSLMAFEDALRQKGATLLIRQGDRREVLLKLARDLGINEIFANKIYEPSWIESDKRITEALGESGIELDLYPGSLLYDPFVIKTGQGNPFQVFTPFWKACLLRDSSPASPLAEPEQIPSFQTLKGSSVSDLKLLPSIHWDNGIKDSWTPGPEGARQALEDFVMDALSDYSIGRDVPSTLGTSRLSPFLHFGEISPRMIWHAVRRHSAASKSAKKSAAGPNANKTLSSEDIYLKELGWREFAHHILCNFPQSADQALGPDYNNFPWSINDAHLSAWKKGLTGYPLVDAGMRELWQTGWMHNRVRMVVASFLVKHLLQPWQDGARWFWETLVDADLPNNSMGWQWSAGSGADAAPYFRIFNPVLQGEKFDPHGEYVRKWVPEIATLPDAYIHKPWMTPSIILQSSKIEIGKTYPAPIVDHSFARQRALEALSQLKKTRAASTTS